MKSLTHREGNIKTKAEMELLKNVFVFSYSFKIFITKRSEAVTTQQSH